MFDYNLVQKVKVGDKFIKKAKEVFLWNVLQQKTSKIGFWVDDWVLTIKFKHFTDFLEIS